MAERSDLLQKRGRPNIVLLVIDCGRPDRFSTYGHYRSTTPHMDALAANGIVYEKAYSVDTATPLSHFALMSGQSDWNGRAWLDTAGIAGRLAFLYRRVLRRLGISDYVGGYEHSRHSLLAALKAQGYFTLGLSANQLVSPSTLKPYAGFDAYLEDELFAGLESDPIIEKRLKHYGVIDSKANRQAVYLTADRVMGLAQARLAEEASEQPFFLFMNVMDCHDPYLVHEDYEEDFGFVSNSPFNSDLRNRQRDESIASHWTDTRDLDSATVDLLRWNYDRCLGYVDAQLGQFVNWLDERDQLENTVFFILADHAEQLGERGRFTHSLAPSEEQLHIPLIVSGGGYTAAGQRVDAHVSLVDVRPSIFDLLALNDSFTHRSGQSLFTPQRSGTRPAVIADASESRSETLMGGAREEVTPEELDVMEARLRDLGYLD